MNTSSRCFPCHSRNIREINCFDPMCSNFDPRCEPCFSKKLKGVVCPFQCGPCSNKPKTKVCRVVGCSKCLKFSSHYCKNCGNSDSTHFSRDCPSLQRQIRPSLKRCRAVGCTTCPEGKTHFCRYCRDTDSTHCSRNCPQKV